MPKTKPKSNVRSGGTSIKPNTKLNKWVAGILALVIAAVGSYFLVFSKAAEPDGCTNSNVKVFQTAPCVQIVKSMVNIVMFSPVTDTNNAGFDGPLNDALNKISSMGLFSACGGYVPTNGVTPCIYNALKDRVYAIQNPPAPTPAPTPTPDPTPTPTTTACRDQGLTTGNANDCVRLYNAAINVVFNKCWNKQPIPAGSNAFSTETKDSTRWVALSGNLGTEARDTFSGLFYGDKVSGRLWDIVMFMTTYYNNGNACVGTSAASAATTNTSVNNPTPSPTTTTTKDPKLIGQVNPTGPIQCYGLTIDQFRALSNSDRDRLVNPSRRQCEEYWFIQAVYINVHNDNNKPAQPVSGSKGGSDTGSDTKAKQDADKQAKETQAKIIAASDKGDYGVLKSYGKISTPPFYVWRTENGSMYRSDKGNVVGRCLIAVYQSPSNIKMWTFPTNKDIQYGYVCMDKKNDSTTAKDLGFKEVLLSAYLQAKASQRAKELTLDN